MSIAEISQYLKLSYLIYGLAQCGLSFKIDFEKEVVSLLS